MNQKGSVIVFVALTLAFLVGMAALALDLGHLYLVRNELQNAADAGALAGVRFLYNSDGLVNPEANNRAYNAAVANISEKLPVEVLDAEIERGHWSFADRAFTPNDSLLPVSLNPPYAFSDLDSNPDFVNAVRIVTRRGGTPGGSPAAAFFSRIWGYLGFNLQAKATAYIGFSQAIEPEAIDKPLAVCLQAIVDSNGYSCRTGRMIDSSGSSSTNTMAWTNYSQGSECSTPTPPEMSGLLTNCEGSNSTYLMIGSTIGLTNGMQTPTFDNFISCWKQGQYDADGDDIPDTPLPKDIRGYPTKGWRVKLPVIDCGEGFGPINGCTSNVLVVGSVEVEVLWITESGEGHLETPTEMNGWINSSPDNTTRWNDFVETFSLKNYTSTGEEVPAELRQKSIYLKPVCTPYVSTSMGGSMFNFHINYPVLVD